MTERIMNKGERETVAGHPPKVIILNFLKIIGRY
jgi:hypothetical protein